MMEFITFHHCFMNVAKYFISLII